jgi:hypothetical protein
MTIRTIIIWVFGVMTGGATDAIAQFHPAAGRPGSHAIHKDSNIIVGWASSCTVNRGLEDASDSSGALASFGLPENATGPADGQVVSLGDGGEATLFFSPPITNGPGYDFAVFENAFSDTYLELAFVEVSSDGIHFVRFPSESLTDTLEQIGTFGTIEPTNIHHLAGKYRVFWGTPFDLEELSDSHNIDINAITHVRIKDVVGSLDPAYASYDSKGRKINDPFPTAFPSGGFDLDAVAVIRQQHLWTTSASSRSINISAYPNPGLVHQPVHLSSPQPFEWQLFHMNGKRVKECSLYATDHRVSIDVVGGYILRYRLQSGQAGSIIIYVNEI